MACFRLSNDILELFQELFQDLFHAFSHVLRRKFGRRPFSARG
jgi:hypothetical protein